MRLNIGVTVDASKIASTINGYEKALLKAVEETGLRVDRLAKSNIREEKLVDTGRLRSSMHVQRKGETYSYQSPGGDLRQFSQDGTIKTQIGKYEVVVGTNVEYAMIHEFGGVIPVTPLMRKYFWYRYYRAMGGKRPTKRQKKQPWNRLAGPEIADRWKWMALMRKRFINVKARPYLGPAYDKVRKEEYLKKRLKKHFEDASK